MCEEISKADMEALSNGIPSNLGDAWNGEDETKEVHSSEDAELINIASIGDGNENANGTLFDEALIGVDFQLKKDASKKSKGRVSAVSSITTCDVSPVKKSSSYTVASPVQQLSILTVESPSKNRERDEKIRLLREKKMIEQKKKEEELRESIARAEEVRKRQDEERKRRVEEQKRREEEHRALVEERRRRLWDEEFERRQSIIKRTAEREARIDFKKPYKSANLVQLSGPQQYQILQSLNCPENLGKDQMPPSQLTYVKNSIYMAVKLARSDIITPKSSDEGDVLSGSYKLTGATKFCPESRTRKSVAILSNVKVAQNFPTQRKQGSMFNSMHQLTRGNSTRRSSISRKDSNLKSKSFGSGLDKNVGLKPKVVSSKSAHGLEREAVPIYLLRSTSPSKSRARSMGNMQRNKVEVNGGSIASKSSIIHGNQKDRGFVIATKPAPKPPREKTPARVKQTMAPPAAAAPPPPVNSYQQQQAAFDRLRSRRSKTPVVLGKMTEVKYSEDAPNVCDSLMIKSLDSNMLSKNLKKMRSSWAPKDKDKQEKSKQTAVKAIQKKMNSQPQKPTTLPEKLVEVEAFIAGEGRQVATDQVVSVKEDNETKKEAVPSNPTSHTSTPTPTSEGATPGSSKKLSQVEEHQKKLAENRRLARERAEQKAEEERLRLEKLRIEEEERQRREEEEARRQEEEELRMLEEAKKIEHERYLKAVEEEMERRKQEEERQEAERKEKLEAELKAQEEAEKREKERMEKMRRMAEEKEERKKKLEMIMKRVKADEPTSKMDPVVSPMIEDASLSVTANITSQPSNSDVSKHLPSDALRNDVDTSPNFKSPLLQKMLGKKLKGNVHPSVVKLIGDVESGTKSSDELCSPEETSAVTESENKTSSSPEATSGEISPVQVLESPFTDTTSDNKELETAPSDSTNQSLSDKKTEMTDQIKKMTEDVPSLVEELTKVVCKIDSDLVDAEFGSATEQVCENKSSDLNYHQHVDVVIEDDIECVIENEEDSLIPPKISLVAINNGNLANEVFLNSNCSYPPKPETTVADVLPSMTDGHGKSSETASEEGDSTCDSENSQELSAKPLKVSLEGEGAELINFDEEASNGSNDGDNSFELTERKSVVNKFSNWTADGGNILSDIFTGSHLSAEGTGAGESLPKNFGITGTVSD